MNISELNDELQRRKGLHESVKRQVEELEASLEDVALELDGLLKAREFFQSEAEIAQKETVDTISMVITKALEDIFPDSYGCVVKTGIKRNSTEAQIMFVRNGNEIDPKDSAGGGPIDVASFAGRVAFVHLSGDRGLIICDEPFKFVSRDFLYKCPEMLKTLSDLLGHQFILVSHLPEVIEAADNLIEIENGVVL